MTKTATQVVFDRITKDKIMQWRSGICQPPTRTSLSKLITTLQEMQYKYGDVQVETNTDIYSGGTIRGIRVVMIAELEDAQQSESCMSDWDKPPSPVEKDSHGHVKTNSAT